MCKSCKNIISIKFDLKPLSHTDEDTLWCHTGHLAKSHHHSSPLRTDSHVQWRQRRCCSPLQSDSNPRHPAQLQNTWPRQKTKVTKSQKEGFDLRMMVTQIPCRLKITLWPHCPHEWHGWGLGFLLKHCASCRAARQGSVWGQHKSSVCSLPEPGPPASNPPPETSARTYYSVSI